MMSVNILPFQSSKQSSKNFQINTFYELHQIIIRNVNKPDAMKLFNVDSVSKPTKQKKYTSFLKLLWTYCDM